MFLEKTENESGQVGLSKRRKVVVSILAFLFIAVLLGAFWDLYGRKIFCGCDCATKTTAEGDSFQTATVTNGITAVSGGGQADSVN